MLEPGSTTRQGRLFLSLDPRDPPGGGGEARVGLASAIDEAWLAEDFPHLWREAFVSVFDPDRDRVVTSKQTTFAGLVIREGIAGPQADPQGASRALAEYLRPRAEAFFREDKGASALISRVRFLARAMPDAGVPALDAEALGDSLAAACEGSTTLPQVRAKGLKNLLLGAFQWPARQALETHAPEALEVPSGNRIRLEYPEDGEGPPVLAVRLQELFGLTETPRVAGGRVPVRLHLLAPNYRPTQITDDLASFWANTYAEVRKELRARYPKHPWPDDPLTAPPKSVGGRGRHS
ncbi:MAG: ATP-dependent helicase C-terminal domain-containing protein [Sumerlaeia bacterium]